MNKTNELIEYCMSFYGDVPNGLRYMKEWRQPDMTVDEIMAVLPLIAKVYPNEFINGSPVHVDTTMRELVRDFVLDGRGNESPTENRTSKEQIEVWKTNFPKWKSEHDDAVLEITRTRSIGELESLKLWHHITRDGNIKPQWFGFLNN